MNVVNDDGKPSIFISHTEADGAIANAVSEAVTALFGAGAVSVVYSTSRELGGGVQFGENWFQWITTQVRTATVTLVLLTPTSVHKPWVLWEAGAVYGAALAEPQARLRSVRPIAFHIGMNDIPSPLLNSHAHIARGDTFSDVRLLLNEFIEQFSSDPASTIRAAQNVERAVTHWLNTVAEALRTAPLTPTEPIVNEWCERLDALATSDRASEVRQVHEWLLVAFGQKEGIEERPIDIRLHRRLAQLYMATKRYQEAAEQFEMARRLSPRDLFVLRSLGQAYIDCQNYESAEKILNSIAELSPKAFVKNVECAALKGRWLREQDRIAEARETYAAAFSANPASYYLADLLGMSELQLGRTEDAARVYRQAMQIIDRLVERNVWVNATAATAAVVSGELNRVVEYLQAVRTHNPTDAEVETIVQGLQRLQRPLNIPPEQIASWRATLQG
ncbi:toll/interleukin-1 receptor domain-containing protein [Nonomuraea sp. NPDC023979]|uniref:toll/interleukin-1 receptor domain-containing protein n=1 Tax=Nonomuraea sp. NPDC023979 TaxID=3154796 RepID=UPI0033C53BF3